MFENKEIVSENRCAKKSTRFVSILAIVKVCLIAVLMQGPVFATDPIDLDPDSDIPPTPRVTLVVDDIESIDVGSLTPGHYLIVVDTENGSEKTYELWVS